MVVGTLSIKLVIPDARSLKQKRSALKSVKDRLRNGFNISISEIDSHDIWQSAVLGVAMVGGDRRHVNAVLSNVIEAVKRFHHVQLVDYELELY
ncbi:MAG: DUF503 domain-containing protein [Planctomycetes bacterium]|nr:DUF503 domain-containing protein [Planctomycetota bacterium]